MCSVQRARSHKADIGKLHRNYWVGGLVSEGGLGGLGLVGGLDGLVDGWVVGDNARPMQN